MHIFMLLAKVYTNTYLALCSTYRNCQQLRQWVLGRQTHTVHINQINKINYKYQK
jgi:hypothetical protein